MKCKVRKQFDKEYVSSKYATKLKSGTLTQQNLKDQCNVNKIVNRYVRTGVIDHIKDNKAFYGDVSGIDYRDAQEKVLSAQRAFMALPAKVRTMMDNDPANFVDWMSSTDDIDMKVQLGLLKPEALSGDVSEPVQEKEIVKDDK